MCHGLGCWWSSSVDDTTLLGLKVLWWGRIGKLLEFVGGLTVVVDLIGPERIEAYGARLVERQHAQRTALTGRLRRLVRSLDEPETDGREKSAVPRPSGTAESSSERATFYLLAASSLAIIISGGVVATCDSWLVHVMRTQHGWSRTGIETGFYVYLGVSPFVSFGALVCAWFGAQFAVGAFVLAPVGRYLGRARSDTRLKWAGLWLIVAGFVLDLSSS